GHPVHSSRQSDPHFDRGRQLIPSCSNSPRCRSWFASPARPSQPAWARCRLLFSRGRRFCARSSLIRWSAGQFPETVNPWYRRSAPDLPPWTEPVALADAAPANSPTVGAALTAGEKRRTAFPTKMLKAGPAVITGLGVDLGRFP